MVKLTIKVVESLPELRRAAARAIAQHMTEAIYKAAPLIESGLRAVIKEAIMGAPEYQSLISGKLKPEFGIPDAASKLTTILKVWTQSIVATPTPMKVRGNTLRGGLTIQAIKGDWQDVISLPEARQMTKKGQALPWLEWLLIKGDQVIIKDYVLSFGPGRAGSQIMKVKRSGRWRVPPEFSGTINDNFVTRAIDGLDVQFGKIIEEEIGRKI